MDASAYAFAHGVRQTRATLRAWQRTPGVVLGRWFAGSALAAVCLLLRRVGRRALFDRLSAGHHPANRRSRSAAAPTCSASCAATCSCSPCTRWRASRGSSPAARCRCRPSTTTASRAGCTSTAGASRSRFVVLRHRLLAERAGLRARAHARRRLRLPARLARPAAAGLLPHAIPELIALFLPLAAWIIASRRGEWEQLLAATFVTVAMAVPVLVVAALDRGLRLAAPVHGADRHPPADRAQLGRLARDASADLGVRRPSLTDCSVQCRSRVRHGLPRGYFTLYSE